MSYVLMTSPPSRFIWDSCAPRPFSTGRVIAGLWRDPALMAKSGRVLVAAELAREYGIADIDGYRPIPLTVKDLE